MLVLAFLDFLRLRHPDVLHVVLTIEEFPVQALAAQLINPAVLVRVSIAQMTGDFFGGVVVGLIVVVSSLGGLLGFAALSPLFFGVLVLMIVTYLALVQVLKRRFYAASGWHPA